MKKTKTAILLAIVILIVGSLAVYAVSSADQTAEPVLSIDYCNLSFRDSVCIKYAVSSTVENVRLLLWTAPAAEYTNGSQNAEITSGYLENINGKEYTVFDYTALAAKQMTDVVYARAYVQLDGKDYYSDVKKYSILQYAYNKLGKTGTATSDENLKEMLSYMLEYGAAAQRYLNSYKIDRLATADWYEVKLTAGTLDDGCRQGLYLPGDALVLTADAIDADGNLFSHWSDSEGNNISSSAVFTLTVGSKNEVYTPVYASDAPQTTYTVVFKDYDGTVLKTEIVEDGKSATAPAEPSRDGYAFAGWDNAFDNVKSDLTVTATYSEISGLYLTCDAQSVAAGASVSIPVQLVNLETAIKTFAITIKDDSGNFSVTKGAWSSELDCEISNFNKTRLQGVAALTDQAVINGEVFNLTLKPTETAVPGTYMVTITLKATYYDANENEIEIPCRPVSVPITIK